MAKIIDFKKENERRFWEWAAEWLEIPKDEPIGIDFVIAFLVAYKVFTLEEIKAELKGRKIVLPEIIFDSAVMINNCADLTAGRSENDKT